MEATVTPWGWWRVVEEGEKWKVKILHVNGGHRTSLQQHRNRWEIMHYLQGSGYVLVDGVPNNMDRYNRTAKVSKGKVHRIEGLYPVGLTLVEIQHGVCDEGDIQRIEDDYGRA